MASTNLYLRSLSDRNSVVSANLYLGSVNDRPWAVLIFPFPCSPIIQ